MLKIFMPILIIISLYRNFNVAYFKMVTVERVARQRAVPVAPQVLTEQQLENEISFSAIDASRPFNSQLMRASSISYTRIKGGWIDIEQLTAR